MIRRLVCVLVTACSLGLAPTAQAAVVDLGTPPWKCGHGVFGPNLSGCYGVDTGDPNAMNDTGVGDVSISPHVVHQGDVVTVTLQHLPGWIPLWPAPPLGLVHTGPACTAADSTCTYTAFGATNAWARFAPVNFCFSGCGIETDYYAVIDQGWEISGDVTKPDPKDPAKLVGDPGVEIQMAKQGGGTVTTSTNPDGHYSKIVEDGTYTVATARHHCVKDVPGCSTTRTVTVGGGKTVDFTAPPPVTISGAVKDEDGVAQKGVTIVADASDTGSRLDAAVSGADGTYKLRIPKGLTRLSSHDPGVCAIGAGGACDKTKDLDAQHDTTVDWKLKGCSTTVSFGSLAAVNGCFKKTADQQWETDKAFRMNGVDVQPDGKVILDGKSGHVTFDKVDWVIGGVPVYRMKQGLDLDFNGTGGAVKPLQFVNSPIGLTLPVDDLTITYAPGSTTLAMNVEWSRDLRAPEGVSLPQPKGACSGKVKLGLSLQTTNADGLKLATLEAGNSETFCVPAVAGGDDDPNHSAGIKLKSLKGSYDFPNGYWTIGGTVSGIPLMGGKVDFTASLTFGTKPLRVRGVTATVSGINKLVYPGLLLFLQRGGFSASLASETGPLSLTLNAGFSIGPGLSAAVTKTIPTIGKITIIPKEEISIDPTLTWSDKDQNLLTLDDASLTGTGAVKVWDYPIFNGSIAYLPGPQAFTFDGKFLLSDPSGQFINVSGKANGFLDFSRALLYLNGITSVSAPALGLKGASAEAVLNSDKHVVAFCSTGGPDPAWGFLINYKEFAFDWAACDLSPFREKAPVAGPAAKAAAGATSFRVAPGSKFLVVEVTGARGVTPKVALSGPGLRLTPDKHGAARKGRSRILPLPNGKAYVILSRPRAGRWTIAPKAGSTVRKLRFSTPAPAPRVKAKLSGDACRPTLSWTIAPQAGQVVRLVDHGADGSGRVLVKAAGRRGTLKLKPVGDGLRTIQAQVFQGDGLRTTLDLGDYDAATTRAASPAGLRVAAAGRKLRVSWKRACGAARYLVKAGKAKAVTVKGTSTTVAAAGGSATVRVTSVSKAGAGGGSATAPLAPAAG
jgi:hypothetical protein